MEDLDRCLCRWAVLAVAWHAEATWVWACCGALINAGSVVVVEAGNGDCEAGGSSPAGTRVSVSGLSYDHRWQVQLLEVGALP